MSSMKVDISWSPSESNRFVTVGTDIQLYEIEDLKDNSKPPAIQISDFYGASLISTSSDHQFLKCFSWYPKLDHPLLFAIGNANGCVLLQSLDLNSSRDAEISGREFTPKQNRACNCLAWNPEDSNLLIAGMDKYRGENCILLWDITKSAYIPGTIDAVPNFERGLKYPVDSPNVLKLIHELGSSESVQSISWFYKTPRVFVCGMSQKHLKLYDLRVSSSKHRFSTTSKAVYNVCVDPNFENRLASSFENGFQLWDIRNFEKPVVTTNLPKPVVKLDWSPTRSGLLAVVCKDSTSINLYDIQSSTSNDEIEPAIVERSLQPFPSQSVISFAWHSSQENRMLTMAQSNHLLDYTIFDRITLNWSPTSEIIWTFGRKILQCVDSNDEFYECLKDISVKMRKRACNGYGVKPSQIWMNSELAEDSSLYGVWMWLDLVKTAEVESKQPPNQSNQPKYEGVYSVIFGENGNIVTQSESCRASWVGLPSCESRIIKYFSEDRERALHLCGWRGESDANDNLKLYERLESDGQFTRAAAIAVFNLEIERSIKILSEGALSKKYKGTVDLNAIAMALAGYSEERFGLWRKVSSDLRTQLNDSYLRAIFTFLTTEGDNYEEILNEKQISVQDRMAFACLYLDDRKLAEFLDGLRKYMTDNGNLDGLLLTGLTNDGLSLIQRYVDTTGDVQTASLIILHTLPSHICRDFRAETWVYSYRNLLDTWMLWKERAMFDVCWFSKNPYANKPAQQVYISCNYCRNSVANYYQFRPISGNTRFSQAPINSANKKITCCLSCRKPLPRCSLCLCHLGTSSGYLVKRIKEGTDKKLTDFSNWLTWCQTCRHGGHSNHLLEWFEHHRECPVTGCSCKCMSLDTREKLAPETNAMT